MIGFDDYRFGLVGDARLQVFCRKKLNELPASAEGYETFKELVLLIGKNACTFSAILGDPDLKSSALLFEKRAELEFEQGVHEIETYGSSSVRGQ